MSRIKQEADSNPFFYQSDVSPIMSARFKGAKDSHDPTPNLPYFQPPPSSGSTSYNVIWNNEFHSMNGGLQDSVSKGPFESSKEQVGSSNMLENQGGSSLLEKQAPSNIVITPPNSLFANDQFDLWQRSEQNTPTGK